MWFRRNAVFHSKIRTVYMSTLFGHGALVWSGKEDDSDHSHFSVCSEMCNVWEK